MSAQTPLQLILTGANGTLGIPLVRSLLQQSLQLQLLCLLRTQTSCDELAATLSAVERARVEFLVVDICDAGADGCCRRQPTQTRMCPGYPPGSRRVLG